MHKEERRAFTRIRPADDCIVVHSKLIGNIKDISRGGLYCTCFRETPCDGDTFREIDILCGQGKYLVRGLKVRIVAMESIPGYFLQDFEVKKCRLQFQDLQPDQAWGIDSILVGACTH